MTTFSSIPLKATRSNNKSRLFWAIVVLFSFFTSISNAQKKRDLLTALIQKDAIVQLDSTLLYKPYEKKEFHNQLVNLPKEVQDKILSEAKEAMKYDWPSIPATSYLDFKRIGDRIGMEKYRNNGLDVLKKLLLAEVLEGKGQFMDAIINGSWAVCEQTTWVISAHLIDQKGGAGIPNINEPIIDLAAGEYSSTLAWIYYFFNDDFEKISPFLKARIPYEIKHRIIKPYIIRDDFWWMGFEFKKKKKLVNNWNPWCNYNVLLSTLLLGNEVTPKMRKQVIVKTMRSVDQFINYYKDDGACEEGPVYWSHAAAKMVDYLQLLKTYSKEKISIADADIIKKMGHYIITAHINEDYYINFADSSVSLQTDPGVVFRYGNYINDAALKEFGSFLANRVDFYLNPTKGSLDIAMRNVAIYPVIKATPAVKHNQMSFWFNDTEIAGGRTQEDPLKGFFFASKGGYNEESHNHNDTGSFILYHEGSPLLADIGVETYSSKTFGDKRYEIWTMQSDYHNVPIINGFSQSFGENFEASEVSFKESKSQINFNLNLVGAYPTNAACNFWKRKYTLKRKFHAELVIEDEFSLKEYKGASEQHFITTQLPFLKKAGEIKLKEKGRHDIYLYYPTTFFEVKIEELVLTDKRLLTAWKQDKLYRIILMDKSKLLSNKYKIRIVEN